MTDALQPSAEMTPEGEQTLVPGVEPVTLRDRLDWLARQPVEPKRNPNARQKPCDIGLFDEVARHQLDLLDILRAAAGRAPNSNQLKED